MAIAFPCTRPTRAEVGLLTMLRYRYVWKVDGKVSTAAATIMQATPIIAFVGHNGDGKSLALAYWALPTLAGVEWSCSEPSHPHTQEGHTSGLRRVLSTVPLLDPDTGLPHPLVTVLTSYGQMLREAYHCDLLLDEVQGVADAQDHQALPAPVRNVIAKMRGRDVRVGWTTPDFGNASKRLRTLTQAVVHCKGSHKVIVPGRLWRSARHFRWAIFDAKAFDEFNHSKANKLTPDAVQHFWRCGHVAERIFDTLGAVVSLGIAAEGGTSCIGCGGSRVKPKCDCPPDADSVPDGVVQTVDDKGQRRRSVVVPLSKTADHLVEVDAWQDAQELAELDEG